MKKLTKCNNVMINSLIIIGIFIVFFYFYTYSSSYIIEGLYNFDGTRTNSDIKSDLENKIADKKAAYQKKTNPLPPLQAGTYKSCDMLTTRGESDCNVGKTSAGQKCFWNNKVKNSAGGICDGIF
jgi:hypothetical protein